MDTSRGRDRLTDDLRGAMGLRTTLMRLSIVVLSDEGHMAELLNM